MVWVTGGLLEGKLEADVDVEIVPLDMGWDDGEVIIELGERIGGGGAEKGFQNPLHRCRRRSLRTWWIRRGGACERRGWK